MNGRHSESGPMK